VAGGIVLTQKGDQLEDQLGVSAGFVGTFLLAMTTSLPEFVASFSSIYLFDAPQLCLGNIFGSNIFNLTILAVMDLFFFKEVLYHRVKPFVLKAMAVGLVLTSLALAGIYLNTPAYTFTWILNDKTVATVSIFNILILIVYLFTIRLTTTEDEEDEEEEEDKNQVKLSKKEKNLIILQFFGAAVVVVLSGVWLTNTCDKISAVTGMGRTFVGSILLAFATSLPEATVCATATRIGNITLVFGNVLGSNIFNLFILAISDLCTPKLALMGVENISLNNITGFGSILLASMILLAVFWQAPKKKLKTWSVLILGIYFVVYYAMFIEQNVPH
jgi:cation:H+ antiporter